jgi:hypothetical protein
VKEAIVDRDEVESNSSAMSLGVELVELERLPWLLPSKELAGVTAQLKFFNVSQVPFGYPYAPHPKGVGCIPYRQYVGDRAPPNDIGYPGDLWLVDKLDSHGLYSRSETKWNKWAVLGVLQNQLTSHPYVKDRFLWRLPTSKQGFKWYSWSTIQAAARYRGHSLCASEIVKAVLDNDMAVPQKRRWSSTSEGRKSKAKRKKAEVSDDESEDDYRDINTRVKRTRSGPATGGLDSEPTIKKEPDSMSAIMRRSKVRCSLGDVAGYRY